MYRFLLSLLLIALVPALAMGDTLLIGYPFAMHYDRQVASPNFDVGTIYMFDQNGGYAGAAEISFMTANPNFAQSSWETIREGMYNRKLCALWHDNGNGTNDMSRGELTAYWVSIF